jgi:hypothetical protein
MILFIQTFLLLVFIASLLILLIGVFGDLQFVIFSLLLLIIPMILKHFK